MNAGKMRKRQEKKRKISTKLVKFVVVMVGKKKKIRNLKIDKIEAKITYLFFGIFERSIRIDLSENESERKKLRSFCTDEMIHFLLCGY